MFKQLANKRSLMGLIYAFVLGIPLLSVLVRTCYVTFNKNAYQSYSGSTQENINYVPLNDSTDFNTNSLYYFDTLNVSLSGSNEIYTTNFKVVDCSDNFIENAGILSENDIVRITWTTTYITYNKYELNNPNGAYLLSQNPNTQRLIATFNIVNLTGDSYTAIRLVDYNDNYYVDNAFEYSLQKVTQNNNVGGLNLVNWFGSLFLDINNAQNLLYLNFLNWYFNYVLMVSCVYLLFAVLMWFVNLARRLLGSFDTDRRS